VEALIDRVPYVLIYLGTAVEGEAALSVAALLAVTERLNDWGVVVAAAFGAATGDQVCFHLFRMGVRRWLADGRVPILRIPPYRIERAKAFVQSHQSLASFTLRFMPGFRLAMLAACAWGGVSPIRLGLLNLASAFLWAAGLFFLITRGGPGLLQLVGVPAGWGAAIAAALLMVALWRVLRRAPR